MKCPNCGATIYTYKGQKIARCWFCGEIYVIQGEHTSGRQPGLRSYPVRSDFGSIEAVRTRWRNSERLTASDQ